MTSTPYKGPKERCYSQGCELAWAASFPRVGVAGSGRFQTPQSSWDLRLADPGRRRWFHETANQRQVKPGAHWPCGIQFAASPTRLVPQGTSQRFSQKPHLKHPHSGPGQGVYSKQRDSVTVASLVIQLHNIPNVAVPDSNEFQLRTSLYAFDSRQALSAREA